jgi:hypothetical protein
MGDSDADAGSNTDENPDNLPEFEQPDPPTPDWLESTTLYLVSVAWHDQNDVVMYDQDLAVLSDERGGVIVSDVTGPMDH